MLLMEHWSKNKMIKTLIKQTKIPHSSIRYCSAVKDNVTQRKACKFETVFSFPFIKYISILNRLKVYQILGTSIAIPGCGIMEVMNAVPAGAFWSASYIGLTGAAVLSIASLPFRNAIGFLYISEDNKKIKISSMDFWGRRKDRIVSVDDWIPLLDLNPKTLDPIYLTPQLSDGSTYKLFLRYGDILNPKKMGDVLE